MDEKDTSINTDNGGLFDHLSEIRSGIFKILIALCAGLVVTWTYSDYLVGFLQRPLLNLMPESDRHMYYTGIADKFMVYLQISLLASFALTFPYTLLQVWKLFSFSLTSAKKRFLFLYIFFGSLSFLVGLSFAYYVVIPLSYKYLLQFGDTPDEAMITLTEYFSLTIKILLIAGVVFELPVIMILLGRLGIVSHTFLKRYRRHAFLVIAIVSSIVTPSPDAVTLAAVLIPLYLLYEISIIGVRLVSVS